MEMGISCVSLVFESLAQRSYNKVLANLQCVCVACSSPDGEYWPSVVLNGVRYAWSVLPGPWAIFGRRAKPVRCEY